MRILLFAGAVAVAFCCTAHAFNPGLDEIFLRGDANNDTHIDVADPIFINAWLFSGGTTPPCVSAADANDDGGIDTADVSYLLNFLYLGGPAPPSPYPGCGNDYTEDELSCVISACS